MTRLTRVALVAMPVMARSGVYRSVHELVYAARAMGYDWKAIIGVRSTAPGEPLDTQGVRELTIESHGVGVIGELRRAIESAPEIVSADVIVTLISQSDIAVASSHARRGRLWVAWVRGKPWPARGEQNLARYGLLRWLETRALRSADDVWATTPILADEFSSVRRANIIPAGIAAMPRSSRGEDANGPLVWAGRLDVDKRPELFLEIVRHSRHRGRLYGEGPLGSRLRAESTSDVEWSGWVDSHELWDGASIFVGTSYREAFGRSAVEAASAGVPVVIGASYGAAPLLVTSPEFASICIVESSRPLDWAKSVRLLLDDNDLLMAVSDHVHKNAGSLTIEASVQAVAARLSALSL